MREQTTDESRPEVGLVRRWMSTRDYLGPDGQVQSTDLYFFLTSTKLGWNTFRRCERLMRQVRAFRDAR